MTKTGVGVWKEWEFDLKEKGGRTETRNLSQYHYSPSDSREVYPRYYLRRDSSTLLWSEFGLYTPSRGTGVQSSRQLSNAMSLLRWLS